MPYENLLLETSEHIAVLTLNRPKVLNALNTRTIEELHACFESFRQNPEIRAVIVTGAGDRAFAAGADLNELATYSPLQARECSLRGQAVFQKIESLGKPTIAAIHGFALGGGCELALACSIRIATPAARLGQPEVKLGIIPGYGGSQRLPRLIGKGMALQMILTGEPLSAEQALQWGLVNQLVPPEQLLPTAREIAKKIIANAPLAVQYSLEAIHHGYEASFEHGSLLESAFFGMIFATDDMREGIRSFLEKRAPQFRGR
ncbi:MAG: enoyl-CoA hydratase/isomerase family protein [Acidobacteria bacterium]|nr:enoyl-CoA hydratase/isomerase family protein [Acidobacteriota bacterium]